MPIAILIVEDHPPTAEDLRRFLCAEFECVVAHTGGEAVQQAKGRDIAAALVDLDLGAGMSGFDVIRELRRIDPRTAILIVSGDDTEEALRQASDLGVEDYLRKSSGPEALKRAIRQALILRRVVHRADLLEEQQSGPGPRLVAESPAMRRAVEEAHRAARHGLPVLITGPVGAGKLVVARLIHEENRPRRPLEILHCGTLDTTLVDSQLFGHEPGAFTDARTRVIGAFERAEDGSLILDDIDCLPPDKQARLLQPLDQRVIRRLGGAQEVPLRCRMIATSNKDLDALSARGQFLPDLLSRLRGAPVIRVPGIEERAADLPGLLGLFAGEAARECGWRPPPVSEEFVAAAVSCRWRDSRHLRNAVAYTVAMSLNGPLDPGHLFAIGAGENPAGPLPGALSAQPHATREALKSILDRARGTAVRQAISACGGDKKAAAARLDITLQWLNAILRESGDTAQEP